MYDNLTEFTRNAIVFLPAPPPTSPKAHYPGFKHEITTIPKGHQKKDGYMKAPCDIIFEKDAAVTLRDGTTIYVDIYRPVTAEKVPVIINSTIFGKSHGYISLDIMPNHANVLPEWISGYQTFEASDPFYWCGAGYAIINVDMRGIGMSEGDACYFGSQDATDNYDIIEHFGTIEWSNGKTTLSGNSWLGITQWYVAAMNPPHLTCIAPWEGHGNMYEDEYMRGGIPNFTAARKNLSFGIGKMENLPENMAKFPLINEFWEDKMANFEEVQVPAYVVASYTSPLHSHGTFEGFRKISSKKKWLRVHNTQEWPDLYNPKYAADLKKFFDHYLKNIYNDWESTPKVRISTLDLGGTDKVDRVEEDFPLPRQELTVFHLDASKGSLSSTPVKEESSITYEGNPENIVIYNNVEEKMSLFVKDDNKSEVSLATFTMDIEEEMEITGYMKLKLWVEAESHNDMDVFVKITKLDKDNNILLHDAIKTTYAGPNSMLRVSQRELDLEKSTVCEPLHTHKSISYLSPGEIVPIELGLWPTSLAYHAGEKLQVVVAGYDYYGFNGFHDEPKNYNIGRHIIHTGGKYDSHLVVPIIPAKK
jgi:predicted acyl esterase